MSLRRDWSAALEKCGAELGCRACGRSDRKIDCAHTIGRSADHRSGSGGVIRVNPDSVIPLCGPSTDSGSCHCKYDSHRLSILGLLSLAEELQAVREAGGIEAARRRLIGRRETTTGGTL